MNNRRDQEKLQNWGDLAGDGLHYRFRERHPEMVCVDRESDARNLQLTDAAFLARVTSGECDPTYENYEATFYALVAQGKIVLPEPGIVEAETANPIYSDTLSLDADGRLVQTTATLQEFYQQASIADLRKHFEKQQPPRPPNMWEFFETPEQRGQRLHGNVQSSVDEEALAALRRGLTGGAR